MCWHLPIFPGRHQPSIFGTTELNFCVRYGNRCILFAIVTAYKLNKICSANLSLKPWSSVRPISIGQLNTLPYLHLRPINVIVYHGSYLKGGDLFLWGASYLDAFSTYPFHTWLPSYALGRTTGAPEVCPSRSSRTKNSSTQISNAHSG